MEKERGVVGIYSSLSWGLYGSVVSSPSSYCGGAPVKIRSGAFLPQNIAAGESQFA